MHPDLASPAVNWTLGLQGGIGVRRAEDESQAVYNVFQIVRSFPEIARIGDNFCSPCHAAVHGA